MSLTYSGYHVCLDINPDHPHHHVNVSGSAVPSGNCLEDKRKAFLQAMVEFTNHPKFDELTDGLMNEFNIQVMTTVCTKI